MTEVEVKQLTANQARKATDKAKRDLGTLRVQIAQLYLAGADKALGYASWEEYATEEFASYGLSLPRETRRVEVESLAEMGYPTRAIAAAVGVSRKTVDNDLRPEKVPDEDQDDTEDEEIVDAEIVDPAPVVAAPPKERRTRTDVVATMTSLVARVEKAAELAAQIGPTHLATRPEQAAMWHRLLTPAVTELTALLIQLEEATE